MALKAATRAQTAAIHQEIHAVTTEPIATAPKAVTKPPMLVFPVAMRVRLAKPAPKLMIHVQSQRPVLPMRTVLTLCSATVPRRAT